MAVNRELARIARKRAESRCEYCRIPEALLLAPFQIDHIIAEKYGGEATIDYGVAIRQERPILPGVLLVRELDRIYPCYSADLQIIGPHQLQVHVPCHRSKFEETRIFPLKGWVYGL